jgi:hypothetical protein
MPDQFFSISQENVLCALKCRCISLVAWAFLTTGSAGLECPQSGNVNDRSGRKATIVKRSLTAKSGPVHWRERRPETLSAVATTGAYAGMMPLQFWLALDVCLGGMT